ncbi:MAG: hypothetical protein ACREO8_10580 [Luteimonas sp.]
MPQCINWEAGAPAAASPAQPNGVACRQAAIGDDGDRLYPDFVVSLAERQSLADVALLKVKGAQ